MAVAPFSGNANYSIDVDATMLSQDITGRFSTIYWRVAVRKKAGSPAIYSRVSSANSGWADSKTTAYGPDLWLAPNGKTQVKAFNLVNTDVVIVAEGVFNVKHNDDGTGEYHVDAGLTLENLGSAQAKSGTRALPRLGRVPDATKPLGFGTVSQTSIQYLFEAAGNGGLPIRELQVHYGPHPDYGYNAVVSNGSTEIANLEPGVVYYFWSRARNDLGWGPFSPRTSIRTIPGARLRVNGVWKIAVPYVKVNGVWKLAQPYSKVNGIWRKTI